MKNVIVSEDIKEKQYEEFIEELFNKIKRKNTQDDMLFISVTDDNGNLVAFLKPITFDYESIFPDCVYYMSKWRRENPSLSNSVFEVTDERTKNWLYKLILNRKDRLLFFIDDLQNNHIGHIAYSSFNFKNMTAEIDAVLRGEKSPVPGLMTFTIKSMIRWAKKNLKLSNIQLRVSDNNEKALALYRRCGFVTISRIPLFRRELDNEVRWDEDDTRDESEADRFEFLMRYEANE